MSTRSTLRTRKPSNDHRKHIPDFHHLRNEMLYIIPLPQLQLTRLTDKFERRKSDIPCISRCCCRTDNASSISLADVELRELILTLAQNYRRCSDLPSIIASYICDKVHIGVTYCDGDTILRRFLDRRTR